MTKISKTGAFKTRGCPPQLKEATLCIERVFYTTEDVINWCREKYGEDWDKKKKAKRKAEARYALSKGIPIRPQRWIKINNKVFI